MLVRAITGFFFLLAVVGCTIASPISFLVLFLLVTVLSVWEFTSLVNSHDGAQVNRLIAAVAGFYLVAAVAGFASGLTGSKEFIPYVLTLIYLLVSELYRKEPHPLKNWAYAFASQLYVALPFALLSVLAFRYQAYTNSVSFEWIYPLSVFIFIWTSDTGAYLVGSALHKRFPAKLFERISPKKSWVGSIGGGVLCW